jgi:hypothetical protein
MSRALTILFVLASVALLLLEADCLTVAADAQAMECCATMPCTIAAQQQDCCKTMAHGDSTYVVPPAAAAFALMPVLAAEPMQALILAVDHDASSNSPFSLTAHAPPDSKLDSSQVLRV